MPEQSSQREFTDEEIDALADELLDLLNDAQNKRHADQIELKFGMTHGLIGNQQAVARFDAARIRKRAERTSTEMEASAGTIEMGVQTAEAILGVMDTQALPAATPLPYSAIIPIKPNK